MKTIRLSNNRRGTKARGVERARAHGHFLYHIHYRNKSWALAYHLRVDSGVVAKGGQRSLAPAPEIAFRCPPPLPRHHQTGGGVGWRFREKGFSFLTLFHRIEKYFNPIL